MRLPRFQSAVLLVLPLLLGACGSGGVTPAAAARVVSWEQIAAQQAPPPDHRESYAEGSLRFGELRLPEAGSGPYPVAVIIHGGCWSSAFDLRHVAPVSEALTRAGVATWTLEYRRVGDPGGGWPGTFQDVALGVDHLRDLARRFPLDLSRVVLVGHSAGGHLALWLAARRGLPSGSELASPDPLPIEGVVALAGITDLRAYGAGSGSCNAAVEPLLGGGPETVPERYAIASPIERLPLGVPVRLVHGERDPIVPLSQSERFAEQARARGDDAQVITVPGAGHFDVIAPFAPAWAQVQQAVLDLLR